MLTFEQSVLVGQVGGDGELGVALSLEWDRDLYREDPDRVLSDLEYGRRDRQSVLRYDSGLHLCRIEGQHLTVRDSVRDGLAVIHADYEAVPHFLVDRVLETLTSDGELASRYLVRIHVLVLYIDASID